MLIPIYMSLVSWGGHCSPECQEKHTLKRQRNISLGDDADYANFLGFRGLVTLLPNFCQLSVPELGVCGGYSESP